LLILLLLILLALNAVFVMAEMAMVSARKARLQSRADKGDAGAKAAVDLIDHPNTFLSTVQIGITLIGILMGAFGEAAIADRLIKVLEPYPAVAPYARYISIGFTVVVLTYASLIFTELVPKRIARAAPEALSSFFARPMRLISRLAAPLVWLLSVSTELVLKMIPVRVQNDHESTEDEVKALLATGTEAGVFHEEEQELVERVFKLSDQRVTALMVPRTDIDFLRADDTIERVRVVLATSSHSHYPVVKSGAGLDDLVGVVHVKDLVRAGIVSDTIDLGVIAKKPEFIPESMPAIKVLDQFRESGNHIAFVINEYGSIMGLVTFNDLLEAIVGQVSRPDAHADDPPIIRRADGSYLLDGMLPVADLKELMGVATLPREDEAGFETLGGFIMSYLGHIPATGDSFELAAGAALIPEIDTASDAGSTSPTASAHADQEALGADRRPAASADGSATTSPSGRRPDQPAVVPQFVFEVIDMDRTRVDKVLLTMRGGAGDKPGGEGI
jgi:putative hemolysin